MAGPGWTRVPINEASHGADVLLLSSVTDETRRLMDLGLPMVIVVNDSTPLCLLDRADGHVLSTDTPAFVSSEIEGVIQSDASGVREWSESPPDISALSLEAGRIATALARMAATAPAPKSTALVDATLVRKVIRLRRDRERFFPAEIFADPAWDMLLDLLAAHMENRQVAVSSLCIAACVPTTTALRWIRSLSEAGVFERTIDPTDARRTYISLSASSVEGMMAWLRRFAEVFAPRG
jgi:hypothetical protein